MQIGTRRLNEEHPIFRSSDGQTWLAYLDKEPKPRQPSIVLSEDGGRSWRTLYVIEVTSERIAAQDMWLLDPFEGQANYYHADRRDDIVDCEGKTLMQDYQLEGQEIEVRFFEEQEEQLIERITHP